MTPSRLIGSLLIALIATGCGGPASDGLPREAVSGKVTLDGKPLASGMISFDPDNTQPNPVAVGGAITGGAYSITREQGPTPGNYRISIYGGAGETIPEGDPGMPPKPTKDPVPAKYNALSELKAEVKGGTANAFDFDLKSE